MIVKKIFKFTLMIVGLISFYRLLGLIEENMPQNRKMRESARTLTCIVNLKFINEAKQGYAKDKGLTNGTLIGFDELVKNGFLREYFVCPMAKTRDRNNELAEKSYFINPVGELPTCKYCPEFHSLTSDVAINSPSVKEVRQW